MLTPMGDTSFWPKTSGAAAVKPPRVEATIVSAHGMSVASVMRPCASGHVGITAVAPERNSNRM